MRRRASTVKGRAFGLVIALAGVAALAAPAGAAPQKEQIPLTCSDGSRFVVEVNGNGEFTPGLIVGSNGVLVPISFGTFTFTAELPDGTVITDSEPGSAKGKGNVARRNPGRTVTCAFSQSFVNDGSDPELPVGTVLTFSGSVTGFITPRR